MLAVTAFRLEHLEQFPSRNFLEDEVDHTFTGDGIARKSFAKSRVQGSA
jgi:hypothetical protein